MSVTNCPFSGLGTVMSGCDRCDFRFHCRFPVSFSRARSLDHDPPRTSFRESAPHCRGCGDLDVTHQCFCGRKANHNTQKARTVFVPSLAPQFQISWWRLLGTRVRCSYLGAVHATPARVKAAVPALPNEPKRATVTDVTPPLDEGIV